jgi:Fe-S cluster biogenesis protein NfuA
MPTNPEFQQRLQSIDQLLGQINSSADPSLRSAVRELVQVVMDLHGAGLERMLELIEPTDVQKLGRDELVSSLLVLYGLHPLGIEERVTRALEKIRPRLRSHDGAVHLLGIHDGAVHLRIEANGHGCGSNSQALKEMVEGAVYQGAPDVVSLTIEGTDEKPGFVPLEVLQGSANGFAFANGKKAHQ